MDNLAKCLRYYIADRLNSDPGWKNLTVSFTVSYFRNTKVIWAMIAGYQLNRFVSSSGTVLLLVTAQLALSAGTSETCFILIT